MKIEKRLINYFTFTPKGCDQISENLAHHQTWRKCATNEKTDNQTDRNKIIGPSGKILGTNGLKIHTWKNECKIRRNKTFSISLSKHITLKNIYKPSNAQLATIGNMAASFLLIDSTFSPESWSKRCHHWFINNYLLSYKPQNYYLYY